MYKNEMDKMVLNYSMAPFPLFFLISIPLVSSSSLIILITINILVTSKLITLALISPLNSRSYT